MSNLVEFKNIADEITIREDGVAIVSIRGASRLSGVHHTSLARGGALRSQKLAEKFAGQGIDSGALKAGQVTDEMLEIILSYYAFDAGRHCTEQAKYAYQQFAQMGIRAACYAAKGLVEIKSKAQQQITEPKPQLPPTEDLQVQPVEQPAIASPVSTAKEVASFVSELLNGVEIGQTPQQDKALKARVVISAVQIHCPELTEALKPAQDMLSIANTPDAACFTPTVLGKRLGISARAVNSRLKEMGLQVKNPNTTKGQSAWLPTETGRPYAMMEFGSGQHNQQRLNWSERVLELFDQTPQLFDAALSA